MPDIFKLTCGERTETFPIERQAHIRAEAISLGTKATVDVVTDMLTSTTHYENGVRISTVVNHHKVDLTHGWTAQFDTIGGMRIEGEGEAINLTRIQVKLLREILS